MTNAYNPGSRFRQSSPYGERINPLTGEKSEPHAGQDFSAPAGTPIPTATSGVVVYSGLNRGFGNAVIVKNDTGDYSLYAHMQDGNKVKLGQRIWPGDTIGFVGSTGSSTGNHLHYAVIPDKTGQIIENSEAPRNGGSIGVNLNDKNTIDPSLYDNYDPRPRYLDESRRAAQIMSGAGANSAPGAPLPNRSDSFDDRFTKWGSVPASNVPPVASDRPESFDSRFGNWGSVPAGGFGNTSSPVLRALERNRRSEAPDGSASFAAMPSSPVSIAPGPGFGSQIADELSIAGKRAAPVLSRVGKFIGDSLITSAEAASPSGPLLRGPTAPDLPRDETEIVNNKPERYLGRKTYNQLQASVFDTGAPAAPSPVPPQGPLSLVDAYLLYRKRLDANQSQASATDTGAPAAPLVPSDDSNFSGGLFGRFAAMAGVDPRNPNQLAPPPQDDELRAFYRNGPVQPWTLQRWR